MQPLPYFITCKRVQAAKIIGVMHDELAMFLVLEGGLSVQVDMDWSARRCGGTSPIGGFFVRYVDGYTSWSPAIIFEESATPEAQWGPSKLQEPKYTVSLRGRLINRASGEAIPKDEPVMIFRARDRLASLYAVLPYRDAADLTPGCAQTIRDGAAERLSAFANFALNSPERMRDPS